METLEGTNISAPVVPFSDQDTHPTHDAQYGRGGWREVTTLAERDAIPADRLRNGSVCYVQSEDTPYIYKDSVWTKLLGTNGSLAGNQKYATVGYTGTQVNIAGKDFPYAKVYLDKTASLTQYLNIHGVENGDCGRILFFQPGGVTLNRGKTGINGASGATLQGTLTVPSTAGSISLVDWWALPGGVVTVRSYTLV